MQKIRTAIPEKVSMSLAALASPHPHTRAFAEASLAAGVVAIDGAQVAQVATLVESDDAQKTFDEIEQEGLSKIALLSDRFLSITGSPRSVAALGDRPEVRRIQTKKEKEARLETLSSEIGIRNMTGGPRIVQETGEGVLIGVVDSGFDLSHPTFRDEQGNLRVDALYDQTTERFYTADTLTQAWTSGERPGDDQNGHGTHVASIAGGTPFSGGSDGVAPGARFLLVKTNLLDTDVAVSWIFARASELGRPCVVNLSLGHHFGGHDGCDEEERLYEELVAVPGRAIVVAAGNEREGGVAVTILAPGFVSARAPRDVLRQIAHMASIHVKREKQPRSA